MKKFSKITGNSNYKLLIAFFLLTAIAGFLFLSVARTAYADTPIQDINGSSLTREEIIEVDAAAVEGSCFSVLEPSSILTCGLVAVLKFAVVILSAAVTMFTWVVDVNNMNAIMNAGAGAGGTGGSVIYELWIKVRDFLNIAFILVLLFSAFATIFQVEKYNYKKLLLNIILMALLVNFSFPIARFIIDISNVLMYTLIRTLLPQNSLTDIALKSGLTTIIVPTEASLAYLLSAIVFTFLLAVTFLAIGVMLIIRMVALAILTIFSPIAFVGAILPGKAATYASDWWGNLFKYAFFGPIMIFMIYIATEMMKAMGNTSVISTFVTAGEDNAQDPNLFGAIAFFSIPVAVLWMGLGMAQKSSIAGASTVMGYAQKTGGWAGKKFSGYSWGKRQYDDYTAIKKKEKEDALKNKPHFVDRTLSWLGDPKAQERVAKKHVSSNKDAIKKSSEAHEGDGVNNLVKDINNSITTPPATKQDKIDAAGRVQQALSRGKEFEDELKNRIEGAEAGTDKEMLKLIIDAQKAGTLKSNAKPQEIKSWYYAQARKIISSAEQSGVEKRAYVDPNMDTESLYDKTVKHAKSTYEKVRYDASTRS